jgi:hypothetical protein
VPSKSNLADHPSRNDISWPFFQSATDVSGVAVTVFNQLVSSLEEVGEKGCMTSHSGKRQKQPWGTQCTWFERVCRINIYIYIYIHIYIWVLSRSECIIFEITIGKKLALKRVFSPQVFGYKEAFQNQQHLEGCGFNKPYVFNVDISICALPQGK